MSVDDDRQSVLKSGAESNGADTMPPSASCVIFVMLSVPKFSSTLRFMKKFEIDICFAISNIHLRVTFVKELALACVQLCFGALKSCYSKYPMTAGLAKTLFIIIGHWFTVAQ